MILMNCFIWYTVGLHRLQAAGAGQGMYLVQGPLGLLISSESCVCVNPQSLISQKIPSASFLPSPCQQLQLSCAGLRMVSSPIHSMAKVNMNKVKNFMTKTTAAFIWSMQIISWRQPQLSCTGLRLVSSPIHSVAGVNLNKVETFMANTTPASKCTHKRPKITINGDSQEFCKQRFWNGYKLYILGSLFQRLCPKIGHCKKMS